MYMPEVIEIECIVFIAFRLIKCLGNQKFFCSQNTFAFTKNTEVASMW